MLTFSTKINGYQYKNDCGSLRCMSVRSFAKLWKKYQLNRLYYVLISSKKKVLEAEDVSKIHWSPCIIRSKVTNYITTLSNINWNIQYFCQNDTVRNLYPYYGHIIIKNKAFKVALNPNVRCLGFATNTE